MFLSCGCALMALIVWRSMYTGILSLGKNPGENPLSFKVYVCCIFGFQGKNWQRMSKVHLSGSQRCILNWPQVIFPNFKHRTSDLTFSLSRSMFIERSVFLLYMAWVVSNEGNKPLAKHGLIPPWAPAWGEPGSSSLANELRQIGLSEVPSGYD